MLEIAAAALPEGTTMRDVGEERVYAHTGGLSINRNTGAWYAHASGVGGYSAVGLLRFARSWDSNDATAWVLAFLASHPGTGVASADTEDGAGDAASAANRIRAEAILAAVVPVEGTSAEAYLRSRGLVPPYPECAGFVPYARVGEGALVGQLRAHDRTVGVQLAYLDPEGRKSLVLPQRRRFNLEKAPGAGFLIPSEASGPTLLCEGIEDALSLALLGIGPVVGLPGVSALQHLALPKGTDAVVFRDGDAPGLPADKALIAGVDHLLLEGVVVRVTTTPAKQDANAILQSGGQDPLLQLINDAPPAEPSLDGEVVRMSRLTPFDYDRERKDIANKHGVKLSTLDDAVKEQRRHAEAEVPQDAPDTSEPAWDGPLPLLADIMDAALEQIKRYIVAPKPKQASAVLWCAHTHVVHNERIGLPISPRLAIQTKTPSSGKTTLLEVVAELSFRGKCSSSVSAASVMRMMHEQKLTYCLDEADQQLAEQDTRHDLMEILNSGHRRRTALADRCVPTPDGGWKAVTFDVWGAVAFAGIGELPPTLQDRSVIIALQRATGAEVPEHLRDGTSPELQTLRRQLSGWADGLFDLPDPELPAALMREHGRVGDNWRPLIAIADLAGGQWPELARQAAMEAVGAERKQTETERLLAGIHRAFDKQSDTLPLDAPNNRDRLCTKPLLSILWADEEDDWGVVNRGRSITAAWLRERLRGLLNPPGASDWYTGSNPRIHHSGYLRLQFADAWRRYTAEAENTKTAFFDPFEASGASSSASAPDAIPQNSADFHKKEAAPGALDEGGIRCTAEDEKTQDFCGGAPDEPDAPDAPDGLGGSRNIKKPANRGPRKSAAPTTNGSAAEEAPEEEGTGAFELESQIKGLRVGNPDRSIQWIARHVGQPIDVVRIYLGEEDRPL